MYEENVSNAIITECSIVSISSPKKQATPIIPLNINMNKRKKNYLSIIATALLCLVALTISIADIPALENGKNALRSMLVGNSEFNENLGNLTLVGNIFPTIEEVMGNNLISKKNIFLPVQGKMTVQDKMLYIECKSGASVYACADGKIKNISKDGLGSAVTISHSNGYESMYQNCDIVIGSVGDTVKRADLLGSVMKINEKTELIFTYSMDGKLLDPALYVVQ